MIINERPRTAEFIVFIENDAFSIETVTVTAPSGGYEAGQVLGDNGTAYVAYDDGASDGSETVAGILYSAVEEGTGSAVIVKRHAVVKSYKLIYTGTEATVVAELLALGIKVK